MDKQFNTILSIALIPQIVDLIITNYKISESLALEKFYSSKTYELLSKEDTKIWHYSPLTIYIMWESEEKTGEIIFPEG